MPDGFEQLITTGQPFFRGLAANNEKAWFEAHKAQYTDEIRKPGEFFASLMTDEIRALTGKSHSEKVYRIYRDVRFSKDKRPYNPWLHISWSQLNHRHRDPAWFFALEAEAVFVGIGVMGLAKEELTAYRNWVDADGDRIMAANAALQAAGGGLSDWGGEPLKRVPKPFDQDHPHGDLLKRKSMTASMPVDVEMAMEKGLIPATKAAMVNLMPLWTEMAEGLAEAKA